MIESLLYLKGIPEEKCREAYYNKDQEPEEVCVAKLKLAQYFIEKVIERIQILEKEKMLQWAENKVIELGLQNGSENE